MDCFGLGWPPIINVAVLAMTGDGSLNLPVELYHKNKQLANSHIL